MKASLEKALDQLEAGAEIEIMEKAPFNGPLDVRIGEKTHTVGYAVASIKTLDDVNIGDTLHLVRIGGLEVTIHLDLPASERPNLEKCLGMFEDFCVVTASVRQGLAVGVKVLDRDGGTLFESAGEPVEGGP